MAGPQPSVFQDLLTSAKELRALERWYPLERTLTRALELAASEQQSQTVLEQVLLVPEPIRADGAAWHLLCVWAWCVNRQPQAILDFNLTTVLLPEAQIYLCWALVRLNRAQEGLALLEAIWPKLSGEQLGFAWRTRAQAQAALGQSGWEHAFRQAAALLQGRRRSLSLAEEGHLLDQAGQGSAAREVWREALGGFGQDVFHQAWLRFNLGVSAFRDGAPEAEHHLLLLTALARQRAARPFASRAWSGLGTFRRLHGEWDRAETAYRHAERLAGPDQDDAFQALRGAAHVQRLRGLPELALEDLHRALELRREIDGDESQPHWVQLDVACCWAQLEQPERAWKALEQAGALNGVNSLRARVLRAELARQTGDVPGAAAQLTALELHGPWAHEEHLLFPALFALAGETSAGAPSPAPGPTQVEVWAAGVLRVHVNGRDVQLSPTGRAAELLVAMLELGNNASTEALSGLLYPDAPLKSRGPQQQLSALVRSLRLTLGWKGSIQAMRGAYLLDPKATWEYDVRRLRSAQTPLPGFLEGVYSNWVRERQPTV